MSALLVHIKDSMKEAMRAKQKDRLGAIRMLLAQVKQVEVDQKIEVTDADVLAILDKMIKQRKDSISQFESADRHDLADKEKLEMEALQEFLPQALNDDEVAAMIDSAISESGAESMRDMGKVMAILKPQMQGRADMGAVSGLVKSKLN
ncbi:GatB/YqeY domain-containing protein [Aliikangiella sp. G2MR2-5]|uniref:GatB/YqeY domain-containing protein n=1 Tax=Aliikangiella sp. G2MR2-5 TaxID=2788943 RepID=UPI0018ABB0EF|nr:GatB/YqeY domain-containing protein [Aliikangiella sp. G2MR2-5]